MSTPCATRRFASDDRLDSQLTFLQSSLVLALADGAPSYSAIVRRAVGLLVNHVGALAEAGRVAGLPGLRSQDAAQEREAMKDYARITDAPAPRRHTDDRGRLLTWQESVR
jgi:hypothetical protein